MDRKKQEMLELIYHYLVGIISREDEILLREWIKEDKKNEVLFNSIITGDGFVKWYKQYNGVDRIAALKKFESKLVKLKSLRMLVMRYVAVLILPITIGLAIWWVGEKESRLCHLPEGKIIPGGMKAILRLADGQCVRLEPDSLRIIDAGQTVQIVKSDSGIVYMEDMIRGDELYYNELETPRGGEYRLTLADGTVVYLNSESRLRYPVTFAKDKREVYLKGEAYFDVSKEREIPFHVVVGDVEVEVYGTSFNINAYQFESVRTTLVSGKVGVRVRTTGEETVLLPNQMAEFDGETKALSVKDVYAYNYVAWKSGEFVFDKESLGEIMERLSMWYDTKVFFDREELKEKRFTGIVTRFADVAEILSLIESTTSVHFKLNGNVIIVTE